MTKAELVAQIAFQLSRLSARNAQHDFELLALDFARARIASNLIPATGPVGAGGDQGRDFESFKSYLIRAFDNSNPFLALLSDEIIVGAATIQQGSTLPGKIEQDLAKIFESSQRPGRILYFCVHPLPVGKRHALQEKCSETYGANLEIFDSEALSLHLADSDVAWIAIKYLDIPSDVYPVPAFDQAYSSLRERWIHTDQEPESYADFLAIKSGLRMATFDKRANVDLNEWLNRMRKFIDAGFPQLEQRARYEVCVAELRGRGSLTPALPYFQRFFELVDENSPPSQILDGAVLLSYAWTACRVGAAEIGPALIARKLQLLEESISAALVRTTSSSDRCTLLEAFAALGALPEDGESLEIRTARVMERWAPLVEAAKDNPLFPMTPLADMLEILSVTLGYDPRFRALASEVDAMSATQTSSGEIGDRARRRALVHIENGRIVAAIDELQLAKASWFSGQSLIGSILAMLLLSDLYAQLHLHYASRYYAAGAMFVALKKVAEVPKYVAQSAFMVASTFYQAGEGMTFVRSVAQALTLHSNLASDAQDWDKHEDVKRAIVHSGLFRSVSAKLAPSLVSQIDDAIASWNLSSAEIDALKDLSENAWVTEASCSTVLATINEQIGCSPFSDIGPRTKLNWAALGLTWTVTHEDSNEGLILAQEVAATLQIIQADLAEMDLLLVRSDVVINVREIDDAKVQFEEVPSNHSLTWRLGIPSASGLLSISDLGARLAGIAIAILRFASALPDAEFYGIVERHMTRGLSLRTMSVRPARELLQFATPDMAAWASLRSLETPELEFTFNAIEVPEMQMPQGPGYGYSLERAQETIQRRYDNSIPAVSLTLPRLLSNERSREIIVGMRKSGLLDWQILMIVVNIVTQWQVDSRYGRAQAKSDLFQLSSRMRERVSRRETAEDAVFDPAAFTDEIVTIQQNIMLVSVLKTWGLQNMRTTPDSRGLRLLLEERYMFKTDDVPHDDPFPGA